MALRLIPSFQRGAMAAASSRGSAHAATGCDIVRRSFWQEIIKIRIDKEGKRRHEDPDRVIKRFQEQRRSDGESLLDLHFYNEKHEKAWMKRKRLNDQRRYEFDKKHVMDLAKYIQFVQDNSNK